MSKPVFEDLFTPSGRRNRKSYFLFTILAVLISVVAAGIGYTLDSQGLLAVASLVGVVLGVASAFVGAQRCRDFGWTGWAILITLVPVIGWIFGLAILFVPGNVGPNRYGPDPIAGAAYA